MNTGRRYGREVAAAVRRYLDAADVADRGMPADAGREATGTPEGLPDVGDPAGAWHPYVPKETASPAIALDRAWSRYRLIEAVDVDGLILLLFRPGDGGGDVYLYGEQLEEYEALPMTADQAAGAITIHLEELLGAGWEREVPTVRLGRLVVLATGALAATMDT